MKLPGLIWTIIFLIATGSVKAQSDSFRLACPLDQATMIPPAKDAIHFDPPDLCVVLMSRPDTLVKSVLDARVTNVEIDDEGKYGIVLFAKVKGKDYYFWYTGLKKSLVSRHTVVKKGQPIGHLPPGDKVEILMFQFETPLDPSKYLDCPKVGGSDHP